MKFVLGTKPSILSTAWLLAFVTMAHATEFQGRVIHVVDGDTFDISTGLLSVRIRLCGVDSPERGQAGYREATTVLQAMIGGKPVRCIQVGSGTPCDGRSKPRNHNRVVAQCFIDHHDIATEMVKARYACDWPRFSGGHYRVNASTCENPK
jgi:endonuclease YncB( thermonuclease family)